jgi:hypothetical protein
LEQFWHRRISDDVIVTRTSVGTVTYVTKSAVVTFLYNRRAG